MPNAREETPNTLLSLLLNDHDALSATTGVHCPEYWRARP